MALAGDAVVSRYPAAGRGEKLSPVGVGVAARGVLGVRPTSSRRIDIANWTYIIVRFLTDRFLNDSGNPLKIAEPR